MNPMLFRSTGVEDLLFKELDLAPSSLGRRAIAQLKRFIVLTFIAGPRALFTSRISKQCAAMMAALSIPAVLFTSLVTLPGVVFTDPESNRYYYFAKSFDMDGVMIGVMILLACCTLFALTVSGVAQPAARQSAH